MESSVHFRRVERRWCPHCKKNLSFKTFKSHRRLYYSDNTWVKAVDDGHDSMDDTVSKSPSTSPPQSELSDNDDVPPLSPPSLGCFESNDEQSEGMSTDDNDEDNESDMEVWEENESLEGDWVEAMRPETPPPIEVEMENDTESKHLCGWLVRFLAHLQSLFHLSDMAVDYIIKFLATFLTILGRFSPICSEIANVFPQSLHQFNVNCGARPIFCKYVACRKCHSIYTMADCLEGHGIHQKPKDCQFQEFPNHPQSRMRQKCGNKLLKTVEMVNGRKIMYPFMTYCYLGLETTLTTFFQRPNFPDNIEHWKKRNSSGNMLGDIYDGKVWSEFLNYKNKPFLSQSFSLGLTINIDWFQPYKHVTYSVGAIYLVILNLPRHLRYKPENIILVGILPGPHEPSRDINFYLQPLVDELLKFWTGVSLNVHGYSGQKNIRCALLCASCDIPAGRKVCGFIGHSGCRGCSRCLKEFEGSVGAMNYGGFDRDNWSLRTDADHREAARRLLLCTTKSARNAIESRTGFRYTVLLKLPYFNCSRMLIVDPMHNLFLGSAKHVLKRIWLEKGSITEVDYKLIQQRVDNCIVPPDVGRIPHKICTNFSSFTADQFKNWVAYYSLIALRGILIGPELECWKHYVLACRILLQHEVSVEQVNLADALLLHFCRRIERIYGSSRITPNMHLHCHLKECILDYGPLHGFWCYPFERYNGLLGSLPNNNKSIEVQLMNRFLRESALMNFPSPDCFIDEFSHLIPHSRRVGGSLLENLSNSQALPCSDELSFSRFGVAHDIEVSLPPYYSRHLLNDEEVGQLQLLYSKLYSSNDLDICQAYRRYRSVQVNGKQLGSFRSRSTSTSTVLAVWNHDLFGTQCDDQLSAENRPLRIEYFVEHVINVNNKSYSHLFLSALWYKKHPEKDSLGKPLTVWECDVFELNFTLVPIELIVSRTVTLVDTIDQFGSHALLVCPCINF